jgi:hypothetical protein
MLQRVGVVVVHGIGEQKRYEHLDGQARDFVNAILEVQGGPNFVTVELRDGLSTAFRGTENTWLADSTGAATRAVIRDAHGRETHLFIHEVWWADVNEPYSLMKQIRFWGWALALWVVRRKDVSTRPGFAREMQPPAGMTNAQRIWLRTRLFFTSWLFSSAALSLGLAVVLLKRLLDIDPPNLIRTFVNYLGAVKLYSQKRRSDGGFLDALNEPPRVSIRRRMIRTLADAALADYDRWYLIGHSQGTVVAFNGLSESAHAWPNYLDQDRWRNLVGRAMAGSARGPREIGTIDDMEPARPLWLDPDEIVYRERIFERFAGFITLGSPLNKFAAIWPGRVPNNLFPAFPTSAWWLNIFDPLDPVSGVLEGFHLGTLAGPIDSTAPLDSAPQGQAIEPQNLGCRTSSALLVGHTLYLQFRSRFTQHGVSAWLAQQMGLITQPGPAGPPVELFYRPGSPTYGQRRFVSHVEWVAIFVGVTMLSAWLTWVLVPPFYGWIARLAGEAWRVAQSLF